MGRSFSCSRFPSAESTSYFFSLLIIKPHVNQWKWVEIIRWVNLHRPFGALWIFIPERKHASWMDEWDLHGTALYFSISHVLLTLRAIGILDLTCLLLFSIICYVQSQQALGFHLNYGAQPMRWYESKSDLLLGSKKERKISMWSLSVLWKK